MIQYSRVVVSIIVGCSHHQALTHKINYRSTGEFTTLEEQTPMANDEHGDILPRDFWQLKIGFLVSCERSLVPCLSYHLHGGFITPVLENTRIQADCPSFTIKCVIAKGDLVDIKPFQASCGKFISGPKSQFCTQTSLPHKGLLCM